jgi:hypothetical protein
MWQASFADKKGILSQIHLQGILALSGQRIRDIEQFVLAPLLLIF